MEDDSHTLDSGIREQLQALQTDASVLRNDLERLADERRDAEAAATAAVQTGNDEAARVALAREQRCVNSAAIVATELQMVELMIAGHRDILAAIDDEHPGRTRASDSSIMPENPIVESAKTRHRVPPVPPMPPRPPSNEEL